MVNMYPCPNCNGTGRVAKSPHIGGDVDHWLSDGCGLWKCETCSGKGCVIEIEDFAYIVSSIG